MRWRPPNPGQAWKTRVTGKATWIGSISIGLWGCLALFTELTDGQIPPFQMMAITFAIAWGLMMANWLRQGSLGLQHLRQPIGAWILGVGGLFGYHLAYFAAMRRAPVADVSLLAYLWPLLIVIFASFLPAGRLRSQHLVGAAFALLGCYLLIGGSAFQSQYASGYALALTCAVIWSSYSVLNRLLPAVPTDAVGWFCLVVALLAAVAHLTTEATVWPDSARVWIGMLGLGLGPVGLAFFTWDYGVKHGNLPLLGVLSYTTPLISVLLLVVFGLTQASAGLWWACGLIVLGSLLAALGWPRVARA